MECLHNETFVWRGLAVCGTWYVQQALASLSPPAHSLFVFAQFDLLKPKVDNYQFLVRKLNFFGWVAFALGRTPCALGQGIAGKNTLTWVTSTNTSWKRGTSRWRFGFWFGTSNQAVERQTGWKLIFTFHIKRSAWKATFTKPIVCSGVSHQCFIAGNKTLMYKTIAGYFIDGPCRYYYWSTHFVLKFREDDWKETRQKSQTRSSTELNLLWKRSRFWETQIWRLDRQTLICTVSRAQSDSCAQRFGAVLCQRIFVVLKKWTFLHSCWNLGCVSLSMT